METRSGRLFDLGPDGLGFIAESSSDRIWAFLYPLVGGSLASSIRAFRKLEGRDVEFTIADGRVATLAAAVVPRKAAAGHPG